MWEFTFLFTVRLSPTSDDSFKHWLAAISIRSWLEGS